MLELTFLRNRFHSSNREGFGHALVSLNIGSLDVQLSKETATHSLSVKIEGEGVNDSIFTL